MTSRSSSGRMTARPIWPLRLRCRGRSEARRNAPRRRPSRIKGEAARRVRRAVEPAERSRADAGGVVRFEQGVASGADGEGVARQGKGEALDVNGEQALRFDIRLFAIRPGIFDRGHHRDDAQRQQADAEDDPHLEAGRQPVPARGRSDGRFGARDGRVRHRELTQLAEQVEHLRGDVLIEGAVIGRAQCIAHVVAEVRLLRRRRSAGWRMSSLLFYRTKSFTPHGSAARTRFKPVREAPVLAVPAEQTHRVGGPDNRPRELWKQKTPTIVPLWREDGAGPPYPACLHHRHGLQSDGGATNRPEGIEGVAHHHVAWPGTRAASSLPPPLRARADRQPGAWRRLRPGDARGDRRRARTIFRATSIPGSASTAPSTPIWSSANIEEEPGHDEPDERRRASPRRACRGSRRCRVRRCC